MSLTAYVRYDNQSRIVPGGPIVTSVRPKVGNWLPISDVLTTACGLVSITPSYKLRAFVRYINKVNGQNSSDKYVAGSLILQYSEPQDGNWKEVYFIKPVIGAGDFILTEDCNPLITEDNNNLIIE